MNDLKRNPAIRLRRYFVAGLLVILPLVLSVYIFWVLFSWIEGIMNNLLSRLSIIYIPGLGVLLLLVLITFIGMVTTNFIGKKLLSVFEKIITRIPLFNKVYKAIREISYASLGTGKGLFREVVLVEYPREGIFALAFVTDQTREEIAQKLNKPCLNIFIPTSPNPTSGVFIVVPQDKVIHLSMPVEEAFKLVISGGFFTPQQTER